MKKPLIFCTAAFALSLPTTVFAAEQQSPGFSGEITIGAAFVSGADNLAPDSSKKTLTSLDQAPKMETQTLPVIMPELSYRFGVEGRSAWYLKMLPPIDQGVFFAPTTGLSHSMPGVATFDAGVFYMLMGEVWKNPYQVGTERRETDVVSWGGYFAAENIADTALRLQVATLTVDVDDDQLARLFPVLARDGEVYDITVGYGLFKEGPFSLRPQLSLRKGELDGEASSFVKVKAEVSGMYIAGRLFLMPSLYYSYKEHDVKDPVFDITQNENGYGANLIVKYAGLMGMEQLGLMAILGYGIGDANHNFYDSEALFCGLGLSYGF